MRNILALVLQEQSAASVMNFRMINGVIRDSDKFFFDLVGDNSFSNFLVSVLFHT